MKTSALAPRACPCGGYSTWKNNTSNPVCRIPMAWIFNANLLEVYPTCKCELVLFCLKATKSKVVDIIKAKVRYTWLYDFLGGALSWQILHELQGLNTFLVHADDLEIQQRIPELDPESPQMLLLRDASAHLVCTASTACSSWYAEKSPTKNSMLCKKSKWKNWPFFFSVSKFKHSTICPSRFAWPVWPHFLLCSSALEASPLRIFHITNTTNT